MPGVPRLKERTGTPSSAISRSKTAGTSWWKVRLEPTKTVSKAPPRSRSQSARSLAPAATGATSASAPRRPGRSRPRRRGGRPASRAPGRAASRAPRLRAPLREGRPHPPARLAWKPRASSASISFSTCSPWISITPSLAEPPVPHSRFSSRRARGARARRGAGRAPRSRSCRGGPPSRGARGRRRRRVARRRRFGSARDRSAFWAPPSRAPRTRRCARRRAGVPSRRGVAQQTAVLDHQAAGPAPRGCPPARGARRSRRRGSRAGARRARGRGAQRQDLVGVRRDVPGRAEQVHEVGGLAEVGERARRSARRALRCTSATPAGCGSRAPACSAARGGRPRAGSALIPTTAMRCAERSSSRSSESGGFSMAVARRVTGGYRSPPCEAALRSSAWRSRSQPTPPARSTIRPPARASRRSTTACAS